MPRGKLNEKYVQDIAVEFLRDFYIKRFNTNCIFAEKELCVKKSLKRVDGLIAAKQGEKDIFVAVVEAKSYRTLYSLIPIDGDNSWFVHGILAGLIIALITFLIFQYVLWLRILIAFGTLIGGTFLFWLITFRLTFYRYVGVVRQVENYPAHEKWIAFSVDAQNTLSQEQKDDFEKKLKNSGIGLIIISPNRKVNIQFEPKTISNISKLKDIVSLYSRCNEIKLKLEVKTNYCI